MNSQNQQQRKGDILVDSAVSNFSARDPELGMDSALDLEGAFWHLTQNRKLRIDQSVRPPESPHAFDDFFARSQPVGDFWSGYGSPRFPPTQQTNSQVEFSAFREDRNLKMNPDKKEHLEEEEEGGGVGLGGGLGGPKSQLETEAAEHARAARESFRKRLETALGIFQLHAPMEKKLLHASPKETIRVIAEHESLLPTPELKAASRERTLDALAFACRSRRHDKDYCEQVYSEWPQVRELVTFQDQRAADNDAKMAREEEEVRRRHLHHQEQLSSM